MFGFLCVVLGSSLVRHTPLPTLRKTFALIVTQCFLHVQSHFIVIGCHVKPLPRTHYYQTNDEKKCLVTLAGGFYRGI